MSIEAEKHPAELVRLDGLGKVFDTGASPVAALTDIDLTVEQTEFVSIMGPSGSGKSTLLHLLGALDRPSAGRYWLQGREITSLPDRELSRVRNRHFGFVFQSYNLFPELTALENVEVPMIYAGVAGRERRRRATELLEELGMGARLHHRPSELSGGEQQRVAIARALANGPTLLLADEPTGNLPTTQARQIMEILAGLNGQGMTLVVVTHDPGIAAFGQRLVTLRDGRIVSDEPIASGMNLAERIQQLEGAGAGEGPGNVS
ncbi:ABC transporter ATP-binding protein [Limnochorda pilosa]|uniref:Macrolide ABC transporter ATP-binding protein n=1 Tax=Limnochorda pilosa TaxID=1555112 RepID=A0A0K2SN59_LIMPI|nr:ABC transporter ATP-binding protein [Limnochorda pilosa]BAS28568.1 macrolide ABC transporter ATP-binding protein [Limnochorda pilosa]